jgi:alkylhydroperoxidase family enzyme
MFQKHKDQVQFLCVYVREAHPTDGWAMKSNEMAGIKIKQPTKFDERTDVADQCCKALKMTMPLLVDTMDDTVGHSYSGMPDRLFIINTQGQVVYKGGRGPFGFKSGEMEQSLLMLLMDEAALPKQAAATKKVSARVPLLSNSAAWECLPKTVQGGGQPLPAWARALAKSLPKTTAAMLELDYLHRAQSPLPAVLRGQMRWVAADTNMCAYTRLQAEQDLLLAGMKKDQLAALKGDFGGLLAKDKAALLFARKLTKAASTVTDAEVASLIEAYGEKQVVAMVQLLAYANFQDRLILTLGITPELETPPPPLAVQFDRSPGGSAPSRCCRGRCPHQCPQRRACRARSWKSGPRRLCMS